jgi:hypothetical protein
VGDVGPQGGQGAQGAQGAEGPAPSCYSCDGIEGGDCNSVCTNPFPGATYYANTTSTNWGIGTYLYNNVQDCLDQACNTPGAPFFKCNDTNNCYGIDGNCQVTSVSNCSSDVTLKEEISTIESALDAILNLEPIEFDWNESYQNYQFLKNINRLHSIGFLAQDVRKYIPDAVTITTNGYYQVEYPALNAYLVEAIKEQQVFIDELSQTLTDLEYKVENYNG